MSRGLRGSLRGRVGFVRGILDLVSGRAVVPATVMGLFIAVAPGPQALASQTWLSCHFQTDTDYNGQTTADQNQAPLIYVYDSRAKFYQYIQGDTKNSLSIIEPSHQQFATGTADRTLDMSDDEITFADKWVEPDGSGLIQTRSIDRVDLSYHYSQVSLPTYRTSSADGTCSIIPPQPLGLAAKQQF